MKSFFYGLAAALAWATYYTATHRERNGLFGWLAFSILCVAAGLQLYLALLSAIGPRLSRRQKDVNGMLKHRLGTLLEKRVITQAPCSVSMHVWMVPIGYRLFFPFRFRRWARGRFSKNSSVSRSLRPRLKRLAYFRLAKHQSSGVTFRKGYGLVGQCLAINRPKPLFVNFQNREMKRALAGGERTWAGARKKVTHGLFYGDARKIADYYDQAIACVIADSESNEALGVLTLEVAKDFPGVLRTNIGLRQELVELAGLLAPVLAINPKEA